MARLTNKRDLSPVLEASRTWIDTCLVDNLSLFSTVALWSPEVVEEARQAFVEHPDEGDDDFITKLKGQLRTASSGAQQLMAEMLWGLLLFPSNITPNTKRQQVGDIWALSGQSLIVDHLLLSNRVLVGIGSGGPGF